MDFPAPRQGGRITVSATLYTKFKQCPAMAGAQLEGKYQPDTPVTFRGQLAHAIIRRHLETGPISDVERACREEIGSGLNNKMVEAGVANPGRLRPIIEEVGAIYERFKALPTDGIEEVEVALEHEPEPGVLLRGRIDAVFSDDGAIRLTDWKTGGIGEPEAQMQFYAMLWEMCRGKAPTVMEAVSIATGERLDLSPEGSDIEETAREVSALVDEIRTSWANGVALATRGGPWCRFCPILEGCPEGLSTMRLLEGKTQ